LPNPGVNTALIYGNHLLVPKTDIYNRDPLTVTTETQNFYFPDAVINSLGDGTVLTTSAIVPGIKWRYEYLNNVTNSRPVKFIEYCSVYNQITHIYDFIDDNNRNSFTESDYSGLNCDCNTLDSNVFDCEHSCVIMDSNFVALMSTMVLTNETSNAIIFDSSFYSNWVADCPNLQ